ncbi:hypothetical protein QZH41_014926, partial [Actinostola sp. cb2023]
KLKFKEFKNLCHEQLEVMSQKRLRHIIAGQEMVSSSSDESIGAQETVQQHDGTNTGTAADENPVENKTKLSGFYLHSFTNNELKMFSYCTRLRLVLHSVTPRTALGYASYCTLLRLVLHSVTPRTALDYASYCTRLRLILHSVAPRTALGYASYCTRLRLVLHSVTPRTALGYASYCTRLRLVLHSVTPRTALGYASYCTRLCLVQYLNFLFIVSELVQVDNLAKPVEETPTKTSILEEMSVSPNQEEIDELIEEPKVSQQPPVEPEQDDDMGQSISSVKTDDPPVMLAEAELKELEFRARALKSLVMARGRQQQEETQKE